MRTGPFSDPTIVNLINRYYIPVHVDNQTWTSSRYGIEPGEENAYLLLLTPDLPDLPDLPGPGFRFMNRLSEVLAPKNTRSELIAFLERHPKLKQLPAEMQVLKSRDDDTARKTLARRFLEEGDAESALTLLDRLAKKDSAAELLRVRALRLSAQLAEALQLLDGIPPSAETELEGLRLAVAGEDYRSAQERIHRLEQLADTANAVLYWWKGWLEHLRGADEEALKIWNRALSQFPREKDFYARLSFFTLIRKNWELPENVDQIP